MMESLIPIAPFNFPLMLNRPLSRPSKLVVIEPSTLTYTRALRLSTRVVGITVTNAGTVEHPTLNLAYPDDLSEAEKSQLRKQATEMFSITRPLPDFYNAMEKEKGWRPLLQQFYGLRPIQDVDLFEAMVKVIIGQQLNVKFAATLVERLIELGDNKVLWNGLELPVFPSADQVATWSYEQLRNLSFSQRKAEYVIDFARAIVNKEIDLETLCTLNDDEIYAKLMPIRGIGRWTVECFLLFGMGREDIMPAADIGIQNALQQTHNLTVRPREDDVRQITASWAPWRSYAAYYLWQSLIKNL